MEVFVEYLNFSVMEVGRKEEVPALVAAHCQAFVDGASRSFVCDQGRAGPAVPRCDRAVLTGKDEERRPAGAKRKIRCLVGHYPCGGGKARLAARWERDFDYKVELSVSFIDSRKARIVIGDPKRSTGKESHSPRVFEIGVS